MKLFYASASPYVRKVMALLHETGMLDRVEVKTVKTTPMEPDPDLKAANPLARLPTLARDDGPALYDSRVICRYLDSLHGGRRLYPEGEALWATLTLEATAEGMLDSALACVYEGRFREPEKRHQGLLAGHRAKIDSAMSAIEDRWMAHLAGPVDMGQIALGCALGYIDFRLLDWDWRADHPRLAAWIAEFGQRPSMAATAPHD